MHWNNYPIIRLVIPFILGILSFSFFSDYWTNSLIIIGILGGLLFLFSYFKKLYLPYKLRFISGSIIYSLLFYLGVFAAQYHYPFKAKNYYGNTISNAGFVVARVIEAPKQTSKTIKLVVEVEAVSTDSILYSTCGKSILYIRKNDDALKLHYGDIIALKNRLKPVEKPLNPYAFNYSKFLLNKGIKYSAFVKEDEWKIIGESEELSLKKEALEIRAMILEKFKDNGLQDDEYAVASSLILGYRDELSDDLVDAYRSAGVMHVLCVSGMHVGIIFLIISNLLAFLKRKKWGLTLRLIIILINVWGFAIITGLSPSVTRAAVMFTFVSLGQNIGRKINVYNTLAASAFFTLIFSPYSLFEIGFLLSYAAVFAIAALYKPIYSLWIPYNKILNFFWKIAAVSIAAQIGTAPFSMYFFHQFPNYFLLSNLVVILAITPIFYLVLASLIFSFISPIAEGLAFMASWVIRAMNWFVTSVQQWPFSVTENIHYSSYGLLLILGVIICLCLSFLKKKMIFIYASYVFVLGFLGFSIRESILQKQINRMVIFNTSGHSAVLFHQGKKSMLFLDSTAFKKPEIIGFQTQGYLQKYGLEPKLFNLDSVNNFENWVSRRNNFLVFNDKIIAFVPNSKNIRYHEKIECDFLILRNKKTYELPKSLSYYNSDNLILSSELWPIQAHNFVLDLQERKQEYYDLKNLPALIVDF